MMVSNLYDRLPILNRGSYEPMYIQLSNFFRKQILNGIIHGGDQLPSETILTQYYSISTLTIKKAYKLLADQGYVITNRAKGTFVKEFHHQNNRFDLSNLFELDKMIRSCTLRNLRSQFYPDGIPYQKFDIPCCDLPRHYSSRVFSHSQNPILFHEIYSLEPVKEGERYWRQGLLLGFPDTCIEISQIVLEAVLINQEEAAALALSIPNAAFCITLTICTPSQTVSRIDRLILPGDKCRLVGQGFDPFLPIGRNCLQASS